MKGNSDCHIFTEEGRNNYDSIFRKHGNCNSLSEEVVVLDKYKERNKEICIDILNGETLSKSAGKFGLSTERGRQIASQVVKMADKETWDKSHFSVKYFRSKKQMLIQKINEL